MGIYSDLVDVDNGSPHGSLVLVEVTHTNLTEVTRMVFIKVGSVVMLSTSLDSRNAFSNQFPLALTVRVGR